MRAAPGPIKKESPRPIRGSCGAMLSLSGRRRHLAVEGCVGFTAPPPLPGPARPARWIFGSGVVPAGSFGSLFVAPPPHPQRRLSVTIPTTSDLIIV